MTRSESQIRVLIIDDDTMSREVLTLLLRSEGYTTLAAPSGDAALLLLGERGAAPEVVLSDIQMPGISGPALAMALRQACGSRAILIAMSGSDPSAEAIAAFDAFLLKPFASRQLTGMIAACRARLADAAVRPAPSAASTRDTALRGACASNSPMSSPPQPPQTIETGSLPEEQIALDERIYRQLNDAMPERQLRQMYRMCLDDVRKRIGEMRSLADRKEAGPFVRQAHAIKGGCGMLGASELYGLAAHLEKTGLASAGLKGDAGVNPLDELWAACDRLERILGTRT